MVTCDTSVICERVHPQAKLPGKAHPSDACYDLVTPVEGRIAVGATGHIDLGLVVQLEEGWEIQIRGRSGMAKRGIVVHQGTVDHLYRGHLGVLIHNLSDQDFVFEAGDRVAQMKVSRVWEVELVEGAVERTERGGFGSTGR